MGKTIEPKLQEIFKGIDGVAPFDEIDFNVDLFNYGFSSVNILKLLVEVEEKFDIEIDDKDFSVDNFKDINSIVNFIQLKQKQ